MDRTLVTVILLISLLFAVEGNAAEKETYLYSVKGADSLYLDVWSPDVGPGVRTPCFLYMFGGGFFTGSRSGRVTDDYFRFLVGEGYTVVSIDYRLGFKPLADGGAQALGPMPKGRLRQAKAFMSLFTDVVDMAVEDLFDATVFIVENAQRLGIDPTRIIANGSSAGAISVLQGEYYICNGHTLAGSLPAGFNYAGVVSFAGAVLLPSRELSFGVAPCPMMLFHGDADSNVPYDRIRKLGHGFFGSKHIAGRLARIGVPYEFYSVADADHSIAGSPMTGNRHDILSFVEKLVLKQEKLSIRTGVGQIIVAGRKKKFGIGDYIKANFAGGQ